MGNINPDNRSNQNDLNQLNVPATSVWINTRIKLPPLHTEVLINTQAGIRVGYLVRDTLSQKLVWDHRDDWLPVYQVSHWMNLPEGPNGKNT